MVEKEEELVVVVVDTSAKEKKGRQGHDLGVHLGHLWWWCSVSQSVIFCSLNYNSMGDYTVLDRHTHTVLHSGFTTLLLLFINSQTPNFHSSLAI